MAAPATVALVLVVATALPACVVVEMRDTSRPALGQPGEAQPWLAWPGIRITAYARHDRATGSLVGPAIGIPLPVIPVPPGAEKPAAEFWIDVGLDPEGEAFTFDARQVRLRLPDGRTLEPAAMIGPVMIDRYRGLALCHVAREPVRPPAAALRLTELVCVSLRFDVAPPPTDARFALTVDGLANGSAPVAAASIGFEQRRIHRLIFAP